MREKKYPYYITQDVVCGDGKHTVLIYGEVVDTTKLRGFKISEVEYKRGGVEVISEKNAIILNRADSRNKTRTLNWGWAICTPEDNFDMKIGEKICRARFSKHPLTTNDGKLLTDDIVRAILEHEAQYHADKLAAKLDKVKAQA